MSEPDHILVSPPALLATPSVPAVFPFWYVDCSKVNRDVCMNPEFNPRQVDPSQIRKVRTAAGQHGEMHISGDTHRRKYTSAVAPQCHSERRLRTHS